MHRNNQTRETTMKELIIQDKLEYFIPNKFVNFDEYQDMFYLRKRIQEILPDKPDEVVYGAIEFANAKLKPPRKRLDYINILVEKLRE